MAQLEDLTSVIDAPNVEGTKIRDTLFGGVLEPGTFDGKLAAINYALTVYALWYSASLFEENGWTPPKTWDEAYELGVKAKEKDKYLFVWGKEAATYYQTLAICSAIKQGGDEVRLSLENLKPDSWSQPAVQDVFNGMKKIIDAKMFKPGGSGTQFTAAQSQWSNDQDALLYPSGSWIENEMKDQTKDGFKMTGTPEPTVTAEQQAAVRGSAQRGRRALRDPEPGQERRRWQGAAAGHAVEGGGHQLRQDEARADRGQGHRAGRRLRLHRAGVADDDARRRPGRTSSPGSSWTTTA